MTDKINGFGRVGLDVAPSRGRAVARAEQSGEGESTKRTRDARDAVEITDTATRLKAVEARLAQLPDVDQARVEAVRKRIESGEYRPDPARIAEKLLRMEQELA